MKLTKLVPWIACGLALAGALVALVPSGKSRGFDVEGFSRLPVLEGGRVKPIDSVARNSLLMIRGQQAFRHGGYNVGADEWLLDLMFRPRVADTQPVFVINDPDVLGLIGLRQTSDRYFPFMALAPHLDEIQRQAQAAHPIDAKQRTRFQSAIVNLFDRIYLYYRLRNTIQLDGTPGLAAEIANRSDSGAAERQNVLTQLAYFRPLPPAPGRNPDAWRSVGEALQAGGTDGAGLDAWAHLASAYAARDTAAFNKAVAELRAFSTAERPEAQRRADQEILFNRAQPFYAGMVIYILALLALFASWLGKPTLFQRASFGLLVAGAIVHTAGLVSRMLLQGRPPVTNLYSSAIFVGWIAVILGIVLERMYRRGFGTAVAAASGFATLIVAHHLMGDGDTMEMMRAVLDSNFWLATHVVTITIGYGATFLAGLIAIAWTIWRHVARKPEPATGKTLGSMAYGIICFALFFSFVGTVLGGIWADQSWGRFWGWDPKENGALLIVLWNAIILHARWAGYARERGTMAMAIFGNVITSFSWFGVNMLGVGLHSYGFTEKQFIPLAAFIGAQLVLMVFALVPAKFWRPQPAGEAEPPAPSSEPV